MKKGFLFILLLVATVQVSAATFWSNGVQYSNVCRSGHYITVYDIRRAQPVGSACSVLDYWGNHWLTGRVSAE